jgi:predicted metal-dependent peptidase
MRDKLLESTLIHLLKQEPFFSSFYRNFRKTKVDYIQTAGVNVVDGVITLVYNAEFLESLSLDHRVGLLKHEAYHVILEHCLERKKDPHLIWNYATDLAINSMIPEYELPEGGLIPGMDPPDVLKNPNLGKVSESYQAVYEAISKFPKLQSSEWYFEKLIKYEDEFKEMSEFEKQCQNGPPGQGESGPSKGSGMPGPLDDHEGWGELSDEQKEKLKGAVKSALSKAVKEADNSPRGWGSCSAETREMLRKAVETKVNWKEILNYFVGTTQRGDKRRTHRRINRKYPYIHPGTRRSYKSSIAIYVDQSGSVSDKEIELFFTALSSLTKETEFTVYHFDSTVDEKSKKKWKKNQKFESYRTRCGGTDFQAVTTHFEENQSEYDGYIIMTDGYAPKPSKAVKKRCWMICPNGTVPSWVAKEDTSIKMSFSPC